ncbi:MAG: hypothetical protein ACI4PC_05395 [Oscillospiraceae bacterium]
MNADKLLDAVGGIRDEFVAEARETRKKRRWPKALAAAACVCLVLVGAFQTARRFEYFAMGCSAWAGSIHNGAYYYSVAHDGLYRYTPGEGSERVLSTFWYDGYIVSDYGVYYNRGRSLYVIPHDSGKSERLYRAGLFACSHIGFSRWEDGNILLTLYNKYEKDTSELLLDGRTGEVLETLAEKTPYGSDRYGQLHYRVGEREIELCPAGEELAYDLREEGASLLPEGVTVWSYSAADYGDELWLECVEEDEEDATQSWFIVRAGGDDELLTLPDYNYQAVLGDYAFFTLYGDELYGVPQCLNIRSGESWVLAADGDCQAYSFATDGTYFYACVPWDHWQACWRLVYDDTGRPVGLELVDGDITD